MSNVGSKKINLAVTEKAWKIKEVLEWTGWQSDVLTAYINNEGVSSETITKFHRIILLLKVASSKESIAYNVKHISVG